MCVVQSSCTLMTRASESKADGKFPLVSIWAGSDVKVQPNRRGDSPPFSLRGYMKELSIFVDESGDFGNYNSKYAPQYKYKLLQVADMICTLELLRYKVDHNSLTESEKSIFHSVRDLKKDFLKKIKEMEFL